MLQAIAVSVALSSVGRLALWVSLATGGTPRQFRWMLIATPVLLAAILIGTRYGPTGVAVGVAAASAVYSLPAVAYLFKPIGLSPGVVLPVWGIPFASSVLGVAVLRVFDASLPSANGVAGLGVRGVVFLAVYAIGWVLAPGGLAMLRAGSRGAREQGSKA